ncbi:MAG: hypothetical protein KIY11_04515 [Thermoplasmata archaeon]|nr:hypothetical protein [Candidatus Sysuiplasma acidicola]
MQPVAQEFIALIILIFTYSLISINRSGRNRIDLPAAALAGGALMLLSGVVSPERALAYINWNTILLILGMMLIVSSMEAVGFFVWISTKIVKVSNPAYLLILISAITAFLSALILNDAVVLIFTPVIVLTARRIGVSAIPYLIMEAVSSNIGSAATEVGNPQNAYIASISGVPFHTYTALALIPTLLSLAAAILIAFFVGRRHFGRAFSRVSTAQSRDRQVRRGPLIFMAVLVSVVFIGFYTSYFTHFPISVIALIGGIASLVAVPFLSESSNQDILQKVDWGIIMFFVGLFVLIAGVESSGLLNTIVINFQHLSGGAVDTVGGISVLAAVLSNVTSNVPAVLLLAPVVQHLPSTRLWVALALSSTFAGNATIIGAAANVIVVRAAARQNIRITLAEFSSYGLPITAVSLLFTILFLTTV